MGAICNNCKLGNEEGFNEIQSHKKSDSHLKLYNTKNYETTDGYVNGNMNGTYVVTTVDYSNKKSGRGNF